MHIVYWIRKAANTHSQYVIIIVFPQQKRLQEHASMLRYTYIPWLINVTAGDTYTNH
jgi:hypothetical protein